jgi:hypothetical protein
MAINAIDGKPVRETLATGRERPDNGHRFKPGHKFHPRRSAFERLFSLRDVDGRRREARDYLDFISAWEAEHPDTDLSLIRRLHLENAADIYVQVQDLKSRKLNGEPIDPMRQTNLMRRLSKELKLIETG